jgi:single-stranded DNA-binding protein
LRRQGKRGEEKSKGIWIGTIVSSPALHHELIIKGNVVARFYTFQISVKTKVDDEDQIFQLPVILKEKKWEENKNILRLGNRIHIEGFWKAYESRLENGKTKKEQSIYAAWIELTTKEDTNGYVFEGYLTNKLFVRKREDGILSFEEGKPVPLVDEDGNVIYTTRLKDGRRINDFTIVVDGNNYIPCVAYDPIASWVAKELSIGSLVSAKGYARSRVFSKKNQEQMAYEIVIEELHRVSKEN